VGDEGKSPLMEVSRYHVDISYLASMNETVKPYFNSIAGWLKNWIYWLIERLIWLKLLSFWLIF